MGVWSWRCPLGIRAEIDITPNMSPQTYPYTVDIQTCSEKVFGPPKADSEEVFECRGIVILICGSTSTKYILMYHMALEMVILYDPYHIFPGPEKSDCLFVYNFDIVTVHNCLGICNFPMTFVVGLGDYIHEIMENCFISVGTKDHRCGNYPHQD